MGNLVPKLKQHAGFESTVRGETLFTGIVALWNQFVCRFSRQIEVVPKWRLTKISIAQLLHLCSWPFHTAGSFHLLPKIWSQKPPQRPSLSRPKKAAEVSWSQTEVPQPENWQAIRTYFCIICPSYWYHNEDQHTITDCIWYCNHL